MDNKRMHTEMTQHVVYSFKADAHKDDPARCIFCTKRMRTENIQHVVFVRILRGFLPTCTAS